MSLTRLLTRTPSRQAVLAVLLSLAVLSAAVGSAAAKNVGDPNYDSSNIADTYIYENRIDIAAHNNSEMDSIKEYYGDNGDIRTLPVELNESIDNPVIVRLDRIEEKSWRTLPRNSNHSVLDASEWTTSGQNASKLSVTQSNGTTASGVTSITIATDGTMSSGDTATAEYSKVSITQDPTKRVPLIGLNVNTLGSNAEGELRVVDGDGDFKAFHVNSSLNASKANVIATQTGNGYFTQEKLNGINTNSTSGDGTFDGIESIKLVTSDGDIDLTVFAFDAERKSAITLGERLVQKDDDESLETKTITEVTTPGEQNLSSLDSMGAWADDAVIHQLGVKGLEWRASKLDSEDVKLNLTDADNWGSYEKKGEHYARLKVITAIDLTHYGMELREEQALVADRYVTYRYVEGASDTAFEDIDESAYTDLSGKLSNIGDQLVLDTTIEAGKTYVLNKVTLYQSDETGSLLAKNAQDDQSKKGSSGFWNSGNPLVAFINWVMAGFATVSALLLGARKRAAS